MVVTVTSVVCRQQVMFDYWMWCQRGSRRVAQRILIRGGVVTTSFDSSSVRWNLQSVVRVPKVLDEFPSAPHKPNELVLKANVTETRQVIHVVLRKLL